MKKYDENNTMLFNNFIESQLNLSKEEKSKVSLRPREKLEQAHVKKHSNWFM
jgi:hypothetical protein